MNAASIVLICIFSIYIALYAFTIFVKTPKQKKAEKDLKDKLEELAQRISALEDHD